MYKIKAAAQGEVYIRPLEGGIPECETKPFTERVESGWVISHSEQGNHHVLRGDCQVLERVSDVPKGARILYAIVKEPTEIFQDAAVPHEPIPLAPVGDAEYPETIYEFRTRREFNPFQDEVTRVTD